MRTKTSQQAELFARALRVLLLGVFAVFAFLASTLAVSTLKPAITSAATSSGINFQARLESNGGSITADGYYNVEFKLYSASSGGTAEWTEDDTYSNGSAVCSGPNGTGDCRLKVANGYLTVNLGTVASFPGTINWNQQQWLTMNIGGTVGSGSITWDGEMSPRLLLTAVPYAFQAGQLGATNGANVATLSLTTPTGTDNLVLPDASGTVCLQGASACGFATGSGSAFIQGGNSFTAQAVLGTNDSNSLALRTAGTNRAVIDTSGNLTLQQASTLSIASATTGTALTIQGGAATSGTNVGGNLVLQGGAGASTGASGSVVVKSNVNNSTTTFQIQNASGSAVLGVDTSGNKVSLGLASSINGTLVFNNATNGNAVTLTSGATAANYSLTLPTAAPAAGLCLQTSTASSSQLVFASCANTNASITEVQEWDTSGSATLNDSPTNVGDELVLTTQIPNSSVTVSSVSGGGVTTWTRINANNGNGTVHRVEMWMGTVTATGSSTITATYSSAPGTEEVAATEFTAAGVSANTTWGVDSSGVQLNSTSSTTVTYPSIISEGSAEVYIGYAQVQNTPGIAGSTSGFTYILTGTQKNIIAYATPTVANTTYQPTATQTSSGQSNTVGVILTAFINSTAINNSTSLQQANFYVQAASSGSVAGILQANASGSADILDLKNASAANVASFGNTGSVTFQTSTNSTSALQVQNANGTPLFGVDTTTPAANLITNPGFEVNTNGWQATGTGASIARNTTATNTYEGIGSLAVTLGSGSGTGVQITSAGYSGASIPTGTYTFGFYAKGSAALSGLAVSGFTGATCNLNSTTVPTSGFQHYFCTFTTTGATTGNISITVTTASQTMYVDGAQLINASALSPFAYGTLQVRGVVTSPLALQNTSNSTTAFQVQNASSGTLLDVDTTNSEIGINIAAPTDTLTVNGDGRFYGAYTETTNNNGVYAGIVSGTPRIMLDNGNSSQSWEIDNNNGDFRWYNPSDTALTLSATNKSIELGNQYNSDYNLIQNYNSTTIQSYFGTASPTGTNAALSIKTGSSATPLLTVLNSGNVGIGTTTPATALSVLGAVQQTGMTTPSTGSGSNNEWTELGNCSLTLQYSGCAATIHIVGGMNGGPDNTQATVYFQVYQQNPMGSAPVVVVNVASNAEVITASNITAVTTTNTSGSTVVQLWAYVTNPYETWAYTPLLYDNTTGTYLNWTPNTAFQVSLPSGTQTVGTFNDIHGVTGVIQPTSNSTATFQVQSTSANLLTVDTTNTAIVLGNDGTPAALTVRGGAATGTNVAGKTITFQASNGTGTGGSGDFVFQTAAAAAATPVTFDSSSTYSTGSNLTSYTPPFTISSHTNRALFVTYNGGNPITTMLYNGVSMTKINATTSPGISEMWYILISNATAAGSYTLTVNIGAGSSGGIGLGMVAYYNVASIGTQNTTTGTSATTVTNSLTVTASQVVADGMITCTNTPSVTGTGQTLRYNNSAWGSISGSDEAGTGGTNTLSWSIGGTCNYEDFAVPINPVSSGTIANTLTDRLHITAAGNVGINNSSPSRTLDVAGTWGGNQYVRTTDSVTSSATLSDSTSGYLVYVLHANKTDTTVNSKYTTLYNLTGLPSVDGTFVIVNLEASHPTSTGGTTTQSCINLEINTSGTNVNQANVCDTAGNTASTKYASLLLARINGTWMGVGGTAAAATGTSLSLADLAEWIETTGRMPQPGELVSVGDSVTAHVSSGEYDSNVAGIVSTNPNTVYGQQTDTSVPLALAGRVPTIVTSLSGNISTGDQIVASPISGVGMVPKRTSQAVGKAMETFDPSSMLCTAVDSYQDIVWPADDGTNPSKPCFSVPVSSFDTATRQTLETEYGLSSTSVIYVGKVMSLANLSTAQPSSSPLDTTAPGPLNIGSLNATVVNLDQNTTLAAGKTLSINGSAVFENATDSINAFQIQNTEGVSLFTADTKNMTVTIANLKVTGTLTVGGHIITAGNTPTTTTLPAAGANAQQNNESTCVVIGNDTSGVVTITVGTDSITSGAQCQINFASAFQATPHPVLSPASVDSASVEVYIDATPDNMTILFGAAPLPSHSYTFNYWTVQ